jgi:TRAP-type C4-dicarboxylate transport system permease small subunit
MQKLVRVLDRLVAITGHFLGWLLLAMIGLVFFEVIMRYVFRNPPIIADEFSSYILVAISFIGLAYCWRQKGHVRVTSFVIMMPKKVQNWLRMATLILALAFAVMLCQAAYYFLQNTFHFHTLSKSWLRVPLQWPQLSIGIGYALLVLWTIYEIAKAIIAIRARKEIEVKLK